MADEAPDHREQATAWLALAEQISNDVPRSTRSVLVALTHAMLAAGQSKLPPQQIGWWAGGKLYALDEPTNTMYQPIPVYVHLDEISQRAVSPPDPNLGDVHY
jgi:hypothetical protein